MAKHGCKWLDSDMHLAEPGDLWAEYMDPRFKDEYLQWTDVDAQYNSLRQTLPGNRLDDGQRIWGDPVGPTATLKERRLKDFLPYSDDGCTIAPDGQIRAMDAEGIDVAVLFPTVGGRGWRQAPPDVAMALARAYNDWAHSFCQYDPQRLKLNALVPIAGDVEAAVAEIRRAVTGLGAVSVEPGSSRTDVRLDDPIYEPIWEEAERLNVALVFHGTHQVHLRTRYKDPGSVIIAHALGRGVEHPVAFAELLFGGVLERHPRLRVAFLEAGCSWVLYWLFRLEEEWERYRDTAEDLARNITMPPIEYWRRQCYTGVEVDEWPLPAVLALVGDENLVVLSDFPHHDSAFPHAFDRFMEISGVREESKRKILWDNCARLYNVI